MRKFLLATSAILAPALAFAQDCTMPAAATAAGFTVPTFRGVSLAQWKAGPGGTTPGSCGVTQNSDGSVHIAGGGCNGYNEQISSAISFGGGGFFEATLSFTGTPSSAGGWPAFWGNTQVTDPSGHNIELDALEVQGGMITHGAFDWHGVGGNQTIATPPTSANNYMPPAGFSWAQPHRYGMLWIPATTTTQGRIDYYLDGNLQTGSVTYSQGGTYSALDSGKFLMMLGTGPNNPMTVYDVGVWQKDGSKNSGSIGLPVNAVTACRPTSFASSSAIVADAIASWTPPTPPVTSSSRTRVAAAQSNSYIAPSTNADPFATVSNLITSNDTFAKQTGNGGFLSLAGAPNKQSLLTIMQRNADFARPESGGTMPITLADGDLTPGTGGSVTDARGNVFTLPWKGGDWGTSMGQPTENGVAITDGTGWVAAIRVVNGVACFENAKGLGWGCQGSGSWVADPGRSATAQNIATTAPTISADTAALLPPSSPSIAEIAALASSTHAATPSTGLTVADNAALQAFEANPSAETLAALEKQLSFNDWMR